MDESTGIINPRAIRLRRCAAAFVAMCFLGAAVAKAVGPHDVTAVVVHLVPDLRWHRHLLVGLVASLVGIEAFLGFALLLRPSLPAVAAAVLTLLGFSGILIILAMDRSAPRCGCFGGLAALADARANALLGVGRNGGLLCLLFIAWPVRARR